jgi:hypothetical protein
MGPVARNPVNDRWTTWLGRPTALANFELERIAFVHLNRRGYDLAPAAALPADCAGRERSTAPAPGTGRIAR